MLYQLSYEARWRRRKDSQGPRYEVSRVTSAELSLSRVTTGRFQPNSAILTFGVRAGFEPCKLCVTEGINDVTGRYFQAKRYAVR
jgi:hypothetical protein